MCPPGGTAHYLVLNTITIETSKVARPGEWIVIDQSPSTHEKPVEAKVTMITWTNKGGHATQTDHSKP